MQEYEVFGRMRGTVARALSDFGFIDCPEKPGETIYFKQSWYRGDPSLRAGDAVTFELRSYEGKLQGHLLARLDAPAQVEGRGTAAATNGWLLNWAFLGHMPATLRQLGGVDGIALPERWEFRNTVEDPERPMPILFSYLVQTFGRLMLEDKVVVTPEKSHAAFNTGLVDRRYEPIYALCAPNEEGRVPWRLVSFCIAGEGQVGQTLVRHIRPLPAPAHYFDEPAELLYDMKMGAPEMDWDHVVVDRYDRYPSEFIEEHWPRGVEPRDPGTMTLDDRAQHWSDVAGAIKRDDRTYRSIINRLKDAINLSIKRTSWNFKTAVPQYYPRMRKLQLLLPLCLVSDDRADMALAVEKTESGAYLGHTVLPLDWAYKNARLVCRPDSDWLAAGDIAESPVDDEA